MCIFRGGLYCFVALGDEMSWKCFDFDRPRFFSSLILICRVLCTDLSDGLRWSLLGLKIES